MKEAGLGRPCRLSASSIIELIAVPSRHHESGHASAFTFSPFVTSSFTSSTGNNNQPTASPTLIAPPTNNDPASPAELFDIQPPQIPGNTPLTFLPSTSLHHLCSWEKKLTAKQHEQNTPKPPIPLDIPALEQQRVGDKIRIQAGQNRSRNLPYAQ